MAIFKAKVEANFTVIPNSTAQDKEISYEATGLLSLMLSLPDDWAIHKTWLKDQKQKCGRDKLTTIMNELVEAGYVVKKVRQKEDGRMDGVDWLVYPTVQLETRPTVKASAAKPVTTKETVIQKKHNTNLMAHSGNEPPAKTYPDEFEWLWNEKPDREGGNPKRQAYSACKARLKEGATWRDMALGLRRYLEYCKHHKIINTSKVQQMRTFFGTQESFKETWEINHAASQQTNAKPSGYEQSQSKLAEWARQNGAGGMAMGSDDSSVRSEMGEGVRGGTTIDLDSSDFETKQ